MNVIQGKNRQELLEYIQDGLLEDPQLFDMKLVEVDNVETRKQD